MGILFSMVNNVYGSALQHCASVAYYDRASNGGVNITDVHAVLFKICYLMD